MLTLLVLLVALVVVGTAVQLALPRIAAGRIRAQLIDGGGEAQVEVAAFPAVRLLRDRGDSLIVRGRGLVIGLAGGDEPAGPAGLSALDGFEHVDVELQEFRTGPFAVAAFVLARSGSESYALAMRGSITAGELARLGEGLLRSLPAGSVIRAVAGGLPLGSREVPVSVQIELISEPGGLQVGAGGGTVAGYPAGPIATVIAAAVARRLELAP